MSPRRHHAGPCLLVGEGPGQQVVPLGPGALVVGRAAGCALRVLDAGLSARHLVLEPVRGGAWKVVDLDSEGGTFVNDALVQQRLLQDGDRLRAGAWQAVVALAPEPDELHARLDAWADEAFARQGAPALEQGVGRLLERLAGAGGAVAVAQALPADCFRTLAGLCEACSRASSAPAMGAAVLESLVGLCGAEGALLVLDAGDEAVAQPEGDARLGPGVLACVGLAAGEAAGLAARARAGAVAATLQEGRPWLAGQEAAWPGAPRSLLAVPLRRAGASVGTLVLVHRAAAGAFAGRQVGLARFGASLVVLGLAHVAWVHAQAQQQAARAEARRQRTEASRGSPPRPAPAVTALRHAYPGIVGRSAPMLGLLRLLDKVCASEVPVLVQGESGTGKELVARALHAHGPRASRPFVGENCAAIPATLLESELFGYVRGAFTGATGDRKGLFERAHGGTLFLDEIGDMPLEMQKKLLRVLQEGEVRPVGGKAPVRVDVRIVAASHQDLRKACAEGRFREDLYYRLAVLTLEVPALRERREDIPALVEHLLAQAARDEGREPRRVTPAALQALAAHDWPGNVRELRNEVLRAAALCDGPIDVAALSPHLAHPGPAQGAAPLGAQPLRELVREQAEQVERRAILQALERCRGRKAQAARLLGVSRPTLDAKIQAYGIRVTRG